MSRMSAQQASSHDVVGKPLICDVNQHFWRCIACRPHAFNKNTFRYQSVVERLTEVAPGEKAIDDFPRVPLGKPRIAGVEDCFRNSFYSLAHERRPAIEVKTRRQPIVDRVEIQGEHLCNALKAARKATLTCRIETLAQLLEKQRVLEFRCKKRRRRKFQAVVDKERLDGVVFGGP